MKLEAGGKQETNPLTLAVHLVQQRNKIKTTGSAALVPTAITSTRRDQTPQVHETRREETILSLFCSPKCVVSIARRGQKGKKGRRDGEGGAREEGTRQELVSSRSGRASTAHGSGAAARS
ncbi:unnamed protein product [Sphagnum jensenii]|uniref:Uncharacterized protein n=1 Tax=Sphagnum jensenii TaxID=128206 RepID=A0ABP0ZYS5_9BRYO